jgi:hypothetical protein
VLGKGQYSADIQLQLQKELGAKSGNPFTLSTKNPILQKGFELGGTAENNARLALFINEVKAGKSYEEAGKTVHKFLFDYDDLSHFEKTVAKKLIPFYTWSRKNIPLQLEMMVKEPDKFQKLNIIKQNIEEGVDKPDPDNVAPYMKNLGPIYYKSIGDTKRVFTLMNYLPVMDVFRLGDPVDFVSNMISPIIKEPLEQLANYDSFRKKEIQQYKNETTDWLGVRIPVRLAKLGRNIIILNELDRANPGNVFGRSTKDDETDKFIRTRSFGLEAEKGFVVPDDVPLVGGATVGIGTPRESRTDLPGKERLLQYLLGVRSYNVDEESGKIGNLISFRKDARELLNILRSAGRNGRSRQADEAMDALNEHLKYLDKTYGKQQENN